MNGYLFRGDCLQGSDGKGRICRLAGDCGIDGRNMVMINYETAGTKLFGGIK